MKDEAPIVVIAKAVWLDAARLGDDTSVFAFLEPSGTFGLLASCAGWEPAVWPFVMRRYVRALQLRSDWLGWLCRCVVVGPKPARALEPEVFRIVLDAGMARLPFKAHERLAVGACGSAALHLYMRPDDWMPTSVEVWIARAETTLLHTLDGCKPEQLRHRWIQRMLEFFKGIGDVNAVESCAENMHARGYHVMGIVHVGWALRGRGAPALRRRALELPRFTFFDVVLQGDDARLEPILRSFDIDVASIACVGRDEYVLDDDVRDAIERRTVSVRTVTHATPARLARYASRGFHITDDARQLVS